MNPPADNMDIERDKLEEVKEGGPSLPCDLYDTDLVRKIAEALLPGLASACIDNTTGGLLRSPASVAVDIRREMVDYLVQRSEIFVAESVVLEGAADAEISENPFDIISNFVDDFASSKRNFLSRVSGWLLSERREDRIDDLVQEMEINGFWLLNRRESVAQTILKNIDFKNIYHCDMKFKSTEDLEEHKSQCGFRTTTCTNEGCDASLSAAQMDHHDSVCPFKILLCEQNCSDTIMRREMDRHCITVCPMKLVNCPFYSVGCQSTVPHVKMDQHRSENLSSHLLYILQVIHKEASPDDLKGRVEELENIAPTGKLAAARDARSLTSVVKNLEPKLGPLKVIVKEDPPDEFTDSADKEQENQDSGTNEDGSKQSPTKKEESVKSPANTSHDKSAEAPAYVSEQLESQVEKEYPKEESVKSPSRSSHEKDKSVVSPPAHVNEQSESQHEKEESVKSPTQEKDKSVESPPPVNVQERSPPKEEPFTSVSVEENLKESPPKEEPLASVSVEENLEESSTKEEPVASVSVEENLKESPDKREDGHESPTKVKEKIEVVSEERLRESPMSKELATSPKKNEEQ